MSADVTVRLDLEALGLRHAEGSACPCGGDGHEALITIDLEKHGLHGEETCHDDEDCRADVLASEGALQSLHEQAHPDGTVFTENCREPGCLEANQLSPRALDIHANPNSRTKGTKMTDQPQSTHDDSDGGETRPLSAGDAFAAYAPTGNLRDDSDSGPQDMDRYREQWLSAHREDEGLPVDLGLHLAATHADPAAADREETNAAAAVLAQMTAEGGGPSGEACLALHLASAHDDDQAHHRTREENLKAHQAILPHRHASAQERYELALIQKIEADLGEGTLLSWCPVPHPPHEVADLARMIGGIHDQNGEMPADLIAVDLAWLKTAPWPWHRRLRAAALLALPLAWPPSWYLDKRVREAVRK